MSLGSKSLPPPTAEQLRRWDVARAGGCLCCRLSGNARNCGPVEIHHLTVGGKHGAPRLGHDFSVALGSWHHRGESQWSDPSEMELVFGPSYARTPRAFRREYGGDEWLLEQQNRLIGWTAKPERQRKARKPLTKIVKRRAA